MRLPIERACPVPQDQYCPGPPGQFPFVPAMHETMEVMSLPSRDYRVLPVSLSMLAGLRWLLVVLSGLMVLTFLVAASRRLHFAFEYDWIEDGMLASVRHIRSGLPLYQAPSVNFTPYLYTPIYIYAAAALSKLTGIGYPALRLLSIVSTLGCFAVLYALVYSEVRRHIAAIAAVGLFAACYPAVVASFDIGRVDMLYLFFVLCALYATRWLNPVVAALLWVCAFQTKQGVLPIALLALCYHWQRPRRLALGVASFVAALAASIFWLNHATHGWYNYYVFGLAGGFGYVVQRVLRFIPTDLLAPCGIAVVVMAAALFLAPPRLRGLGLSFYTLSSVGMIAFTAYIRFHRGANENSLLPMYAWVAVLFGLALGRLSLLFEASGSAQAKAALAVLLLAACTQLTAHIYSPGEFQPLPREIVARNAFEAQLRSIPGDVLVFSHPEDGLMAGKPLYAGSESIGATVDAKHQGPGDALIQQYAALLHSGEVKAVVLDVPSQQYAALSRVWMPRDFLTLYPLRVPAIGGDDGRFSSEPAWIYLPCSSMDIARRLDSSVDTVPCASAAR
jgi:hypothetical protein